MTALSFKFVALIVLSWFLYGCHSFGGGHQYTYDNQQPGYKYNPIELKYELTQPESKLRYNVFEQEWVFVK